MKTLSVFLTAVILSVLIVLCHALKCSPTTGSICVQSKLVTGQCLSGECECVAGTVPDDYGCHAPFKPDATVVLPLAWSGEISTDGFVSVYCKHRDGFLDGSYRWYKDGTLWKGHNDDLLQQVIIAQPGDSVEIRCSIVVSGVETEKSDPVVLNFLKKGQHFTTRPAVKGMPSSATVDSTIKLSCINIPATVKYYNWYIDGKHVFRAQLTNIFLLKMTNDRFGKSVTCEVDAKNDALDITSHPVFTPASPAVDIPGVVIVAKEGKAFSYLMNLFCEFNGSFSNEVPDNMIKYSWKGPDGTDIIGAKSKKLAVYTYSTSAAGTYSCRASYNNGREKTSPDFTLIINDFIRAVIEVVPKNPVLGEHMDITCKIPGIHDLSSVEFFWQTFIFSPYPTLARLPQFIDNVIQLNNVTKDNILTNLQCTTSSGATSQVALIPDPVPKSN